MIGIGLVVAVAIFIWVNNKANQRSVDRYNRNIDRQETLLQSLRDNNNKKENEPQ